MHIASDEHLSSAFALGRPDGGYQVMYRSARLALAGSSLFLASLAGCSGGHAPSPTPAVVPPVVVASTVVSESTSTVLLSTAPSIAVSTSLPIASVSIPTVSSTATSVLEVDADPAFEAFARDDFEATSAASKVAVEFIRALIASNQVRATALIDRHSARLIDDWGVSLASMPNARVINAVVLGTASGRAVVAVSIASPVLADGLISEPIAYLVELSESSDGPWLVTGMSFA